MMPVTSLTPAEAAAHIAGENVELIDVRTPREYNEVHALGARLVPLDTLKPAEFLARRNGHAEAPIYILCRSGIRARDAAQRFAAAGFDKVAVIDGGTLAWESAGLPVERGSKTNSVDCQVRIAMGKMVLVGVALALTVSPWLSLISGFVGCGMIYAGITDSCPMATLVAWMPWNRETAGAACAVRQ
jgi:rhodanese-related sulfurtransferase